MCIFIFLLYKGASWNNNGGNAWKVENDKGGIYGDIFAIFSLSLKHPINIFQNNWNHFEIGKSSWGGQQEKKLLCGKMSRNFTPKMVISTVHHLSLAQKSSTVYSEGKMSALLI